MYPNSVLAWIAAAVIAYLIGSVSGGIVASKTRHHEDIRDYGSGNAGMTNALRTYGVLNGAMVAAIDIGKTIIAILIAEWLIGGQYGLMIGSGFSILGHLFPVYYGFRGGKGVLCGLASLLMVDWRIGVGVVVVFIIFFLLTKRFSVGSIFACASSTLYCLYFGVNTQHTIYVLIVSSILILAHHSNIRRLIHGEEKPMVIAKRRKE